jgi:hypothetical protein
MQRRAFVLSAAVFAMPLHLRAKSLENPALSMQM